MIAGEIDRLAPSDRTILRYAAVLGASFDPALLAHASARTSTSTTRLWTRLGDLRSTSRVVGLDAVPQHPHPRRGLRGPALSSPSSPPRPGRRDDRSDAPASRSTRRSGPSRSTTTRRSAGTRHGCSAGAPATGRSAIYANVEAVRAYEQAIPRAVVCAASHGGTGGDPRAGRGHPIQPQPAGARRTCIQGRPTARRR